jgi:tetratricopeptide (TPR) repeat protein
MWTLAEGAAETDPATAVSWTRRALSLSPDDELTIRDALRLFERIGDRAGALQLYREFRERLTREYSAEPSAETRAIVEAIREVQESTTVRPPMPQRSEVEVPAGERSGSLESPIVNRRKRVPGRRALLGAAALLVGATFGAWQLASRETTRPSTGLADSSQVIVADIQATNDDTLAARALTYWLRSSLGESRAVRLVSRAEMDGALRRMLLPLATPLDPVVARDIAVRNGYEAVVTAELTPVGRGFVLSARVTTVGGVELATASERAASADALIAALDRLSRILRARLGESRRTLVDIPPLAQVTTSSMRALQLFTEAQELSRLMGANPPVVMALLNEALATDSTFAMAHRRIAAAYGNLGLIRESMMHLRASERFSHRLTGVERLFLLSTLHAYLGDTERAIKEAQEILRLEPGHIGAQNRLAFDYMMTGQYDRAAREVPAAGSLEGSPFWHNVLLFQGRKVEALDSARARLQAALAIPAGSPTPGTARIAPYIRSVISTRAVLARAHAAQAAYDSALAHALPRGGSDPGSPLVIAVVHFARGELERALRVQAARAATADGESFSTSARSTTESYSAIATMLLRRDSSGAGRRLDNVLQDSSFRAINPANRSIRLVLGLALAGRAADARRELETMEQASNEDLRRMRDVEFALARGAVALAEQNPREAVGHFNRATARMLWGSHDSCRACPLPWLGRALEEAGEPDSAIATYEKYLSVGDPFRMMTDAVWRAHVLRRLATLYVQRGDTNRAAQYLSEFVELRKGADPDLQSEVETVRRRLADLQRSRSTNQVAQPRR